MILLILALRHLTDLDLVLHSVTERGASLPDESRPSPYRVSLDAEMMRRGLLVAADCHRCGTATDAEFCGLRLMRIFRDRITKTNT